MYDTIKNCLKKLIYLKNREPEFEMDADRTYINTIIHIRDGFNNSSKMSE